MELISVDPHCFDISIGLYEKEGVLTVWSFSQRPETYARIIEIRNQLVTLGDLVPVPRVNNKANFACGYIHRRPLKFLMMQAVEKPADYEIPKRAIQDLRSDLMLSVVSKEKDVRWIYEVVAEGEHANKEGRLRAIASGFVRYGEMERIGENQVSFICGEQHDNLARLVLPYARNVSGVEDMLDANSIRGQMTTNTLGFSQT